MYESVLVTGSLGFIGRRLMEALLEKGYVIVGLDRQEAVTKMVSGDPLEDYTMAYDICDNASMNSLGKHLPNVDAVVHLAAMAAPGIAETKPDETFRVNVYGTYNVLKAAKQLNAKRVVFASSAHVYGISPRYLPTDENHPLALHDTYTSSKIIGERLCQLFYENHNISFISLRQFNGYGPGQSLDYFIPAIINQAITNRTIVLRGRSVTKDFIYVDDMVDAMMEAITSKYVGPLNIGTGVETSLENVAKLIAERLNAKLTFAETEDKGPTRMCCDNSRARDVLNWRPKVSLEEGLEKTTLSYVSCRLP